MKTAANDNRQELICNIDLATAGQALTLRQGHRRFGKAYCEFVRHAGDGKHIFVRKLISSMYSARWTKPMKVLRREILAVHPHMAAH